VRDLEPLEILGRRLQKRVLALPLVVSTQIAQPEPQLKPQCETASLKISKAALARKMSCAVNSWKIAKAVCLWKTHAGRRQNQIALLALAQRMSCMAATATRRAARFGAQEAMRTGFETDEASRIAQMNAYQNMAPLISDLQNQAAAGLISVGEAQRQLDQRALDLAYADYLDQKEYPYEQLNFAMGALSGTPYNKINRGYTMATTMAANPSVYGQTIAGLGSLGSAYGAYKNSNR
jgi:hypothetical protein